jgi:predicted transcriptional regulator
MSTKTVYRLTTAEDALTKLLAPVEAEIMQLIWRKGCTTVKQVHRIRAQDRDLAYTTTMTTMSRLAEKGVLTRRRDGMAYIYTPAMTEQEFIAARLTDILGAVERDYPAALTNYLETRLIGRLVSEGRAW